MTERDKQAQRAEKAGETRDKREEMERFREIPPEQLPSANNQPEPPPLP